jgi:hypothetical protein
LRDDLVWFTQNSDISNTLRTICTSLASCWFETKAFLKNIRASSEFGSIKVIAYTAYATHDDTDHLIGLGFDAVLIKPLTSSQLLEIF